MDTMFFIKLLKYQFWYLELESLKKIKGSDLKQFFKKYFNSSNIAVAVCSDLLEPEIKEIFKPFADTIKVGGLVTLPSSFGAIPENKHVFVYKDKRQTIVSFAFLLPKLEPQEFAMVYLLENLLGKGIGSKLWYLRSHQELAYSVSAEFTHYINSGILSLNLRTENSKKDRAYSEFLKLLDQLQQTGITADDFAATKAHAAAEYFRENESKDRKALMVVYFQMMGLGGDFFLQMPETMASVSLTDFNTFLKKILSPQNRVAVIIGPEDIKKE